MSHFDETSGIVACVVQGDGYICRWWQTVEEVYVEIRLEDNASALRSKDIQVSITANAIRCSARGILVADGQLYQPVRPDESTWTIEDGKCVLIMLAKSNRDAGNCWQSVFADGSWAVDHWTRDQMQRKLTLQRFQMENPGMDFSGAEISGNYESGGPQLPI